MLGNKVSSDEFLGLKIDPQEPGHMLCFTLHCLRGSNQMLLVDILIILRKISHSRRVLVDSGHRWMIS